METYHLAIIGLLLAAIGCAPYLYGVLIPISGYQAAKGIDTGTAATPLFTAGGSSIKEINEEFESANARVTIQDTYEAGYRKSFEKVPPDGDTGQAFQDMPAATIYLQKVLKAKGVSDPDKYILTSIDSAKHSGLTLIAAVYRPEESIRVVDKYGGTFHRTLTCEYRPFYRPYKKSCTGRNLDVVYEWAAVPDECFKEQGQQAILLTLAANKVLEKEPRNDYWAAEQKWIAGDYEDVVARQEYKVCRALDVEPPRDAKRSAHPE